MAVLISVIALVFSATVFLYNRRASKHDLFLRTQESFVDPERQQGRRELFEAYEASTDPHGLGPERFRAINHALASADMMGYLFYRGHVPRGDAYALWGITLVRVHRTAEQSGFLALRDNQFGTTIWPYLAHFAACVEFTASGGWRGHVPIWAVVRLRRPARADRRPRTRVAGLRYPTQP